MKGQYILIIKLENNLRIIIGKKGIKDFRKGYYAYVGSAMNSIEKRIERHKKKKNKIMHWHIDYLLKKGKIIDELLFENNIKENECLIASKIAEKFVAPVKGFGSSDCKCYSHLFYIGNNKKIYSINLFDV